MARTNKPAPKHKQRLKWIVGRFALWSGLLPALAAWNNRALRSEEKSPLWEST